MSGRDFRVHFGRCCAAGALGVLLAGCGGYAERVERSRRYLAYRESLDEQLAAATWRNDALSLRVPAGFQPVDFKKPGGSKSRRLPAFIDKLRGKEAVWEAVVKCRDGRTRPAWLVVASNRSLWKEGTATLEDSESFSERFVEAVFRPTGSPPPAVAEWTAKTIPEGSSFTAAKTFRVVTLPLPGELVAPGAYTAQFYIHSQDALQVVLLWLLPDGAPEKLTESQSLGLSLATLEIHGPTSPSGVE